MIENQSKYLANYLTAAIQKKLLRQFGSGIILLRKVKQLLISNPSLKSKTNRQHSSDKIFSVNVVLSSRISMLQTKK